LCSRLAFELINAKGHYVAGVNYPTVPKGREMLRITPTPFHTEQMMSDLVNALLELWQKLCHQVEFKAV